MAKMTDKQALFVAEYIVSLNATQAAIKAGYSKATAQQMGSENLLKPVVSAAIQKALEERTKRTKVDADYVLKRLTEIDAMDVLDILNGDLQSFKSIGEWPKVWRTTISSFDFASIASAKGDGVVTVLNKLKMPDKVKNLELLGKHTDVQAWKDNQVVKVKGKVKTKSQVTFVGVK